VFDEHYQLVVAKWNECSNANSSTKLDIALQALFAFKVGDGNR